MEGLRTPSSSQENLFEEFFGSELPSTSSTSFDEITDTPSEFQQSFNPRKKVAQGYDTVFEIDSHTHYAFSLIQRDEDSYVPANIRYVNEDLIEIFHGDNRGTFEYLRVKNAIEIDIDNDNRLILTCIEDDSTDRVTTIDFLDNQNYILYGTFEGHLDLIRTTLHTEKHAYEKKRIYTTSNNDPIIRASFNHMENGFLSAFYYNSVSLKDELVVLDLARQRNILSPTELGKYQFGKETIFDTKWSWYDNGLLLVASSGVLRALDLRDMGKGPQALFMPYNCYLLAPSKYRPELIAAAAQSNDKEEELIIFFDIRKLAVPVYKQKIHEDIGKYGIDTLKWHPKKPFELIYSSQYSSCIGRVDTECFETFSSVSLRQQAPRGKHDILPMNQIWDLQHQNEHYMHDLERSRDSYYPIIEDINHIPGYYEAYEQAQTKGKETPLIINSPLFVHLSEETLFENRGTSPYEGLQFDSFEKEVAERIQEIVEKNGELEMLDIMEETCEQAIQQSTPIVQEEIEKDTEIEMLIEIFKNFKREVLKDKINEMVHKLSEKEKVKVIKKKRNYDEMETLSIAQRHDQPFKPNEYGLFFQEEEWSEDKKRKYIKIIDILLPEKQIRDLNDPYSSIELAIDQSSDSDKREPTVSLWAISEVLRTIKIEENIKLVLSKFFSSIFPNCSAISFDSAHYLARIALNFLEHEYHKRSKHKYDCSSVDDDEQSLYGFQTDTSVYSFTFPPRQMDGIVLLTNHDKGRLQYLPITAPIPNRVPPAEFLETVQNMRIFDLYENVPLGKWIDYYNTLCAWQTAPDKMRHRDHIRMFMRNEAIDEQVCLHYLYGCSRYYDGRIKESILRRIALQYNEIWDEKRRHRAAIVKKAFEQAAKLKEEVEKIRPSESNLVLSPRDSVCRVSSPRLSDQDAKEVVDKEISTPPTVSILKNPLPRKVELNEEMEEKVEEESGVQITFELKSDSIRSIKSICTTIGTTPQGTPPKKSESRIQETNKPSNMSRGTPPLIDGQMKKKSKPIPIVFKEKRTSKASIDADAEFAWLFDSPQSDWNLRTPSGRSPRNVAEEKAARLRLKEDRMRDRLKNGEGTPSASEDDSGRKEKLATPTESLIEIVHEELYIPEIDTPTKEKPFPQAELINDVTNDCEKQSKAENKVTLSIPCLDLDMIGEKFIEELVPMSNENTLKITFSKEMSINEKYQQKQVASYGRNRLDGYNRRSADDEEKAAEADDEESKPVNRQNSKEQRKKMKFNRIQETIPEAHPIDEKAEEEYTTAEDLWLYKKEYSEEEYPPYLDFDEEYYSETEIRMKEEEEQRKLEEEEIEREEAERLKAEAEKSSEGEVEGMDEFEKELWKILKELVKKVVENINVEEEEKTKQEQEEREKLLQSKAASESIIKTEEPDSPCEDDFEYYEASSRYSSTSRSSYCTSISDSDPQDIELGTEYLMKRKKFRRKRLMVKRRKTEPFETNFDSFRKSEIIASSKAFINTLQFDSSLSIPNTVVASSIVSDVKQIMTYDEIKELEEHDRITYIDEKKFLLKKKRKEDKLERMATFFYALPANPEYEDITVKRDDFDMELKGFPGLLQLMDIEMLSDTEIKPVIFDTTLITHLQFYTSYYRERMLKIFLMAQDDIRPYEKFKNDEVYYEKIYLCLLHGQIERLLVLAQDCFKFLRKTVENVLVERTFVVAFIQLCREWVEVLTKYVEGSDDYAKQKDHFIDEHYSFCSEFHEFMEDHPIFAVSVLIMKMEVEKKKQPDDYADLIMSMENLSYFYKYAFIIRSCPSAKIKNYFMKYYEEAEGLDKLMYVGLGRHLDSYVLLTDYLAQTDDFQKVAHLVISARIFEDIDFYYNTLHDILAFVDEDIATPIFIEPAYMTNDMPAELFEWPDPPEGFSMDDFNNYNINNEKHPMNVLTRLWKREIPGGGCRLFTYFYSVGRLPPKHDLCDIFDHHYLVSSQSMTNYEEILKGACIRYFNFLNAVDIIRKNYLVEEVANIGFSEKEHISPALLRNSMIKMSGCSNFESRNEIVKFEGFCQFCGLTRGQAIITRQKMDEEEKKNEWNKKGGKGRNRDKSDSARSKKDPDLDLDVIVGENDEYGTLAATEEEIKGYPPAACPNCRKPGPRCTVCRLVNRVEWTAYEDKTKYERQWCICLQCHHGGHAVHLAEWFKTNEACPVPDCECKCNRSENLHNVRNWFDLCLETFP